MNENNKIFYLSYIYCVILCSSNGCSEQLREKTPPYSGTISYVGWHDYRALSTDSKKRVEDYIQRFGKNGWISGLSDERLVFGERRAQPEGGLTPIRVKDLFLAVYECRLRSGTSLVIPDSFDPGSNDKTIAELLKTLQ